ncbi:DUF5060 domain-containing protein [Paenibacillus kribbensis]|uniref:DUF5060 domain-containing protein n=1 Tax=Paenibacillus kribbensis TaxID=172713 RepID=UPI002DB9BCB3|nr:DUF5060 domain-containing protein [Paenibacillus kribbensis]MEC0236231.1 DUF5060 domain-containing protein [Paenibacillus kribbensis]
MDKVEVYECFECIRHGPEPRGSFADVNCSGVFMNGDRKIAIKGFYNGNGEFRIRFMPGEQGIWTYEIRSEYFDPVRGMFECVKNTGSNHGPVRAKEMHFQYADGHQYVPFGTTAYAWTHQYEELMELTKKTLSESPFNKVRMCLFPKGMVYNNADPKWYPFAKNAEGAWDVHRPDFAFWANLEKQLKALMDIGIEADLILFHPYDRWGFAQLTREDNLTYLDYCLRRLGSFRNIWWSLANEYDMVFNKTMEDWDTFGTFIHREDPYRHLLSVHNWLPLFDFNKPWITHCSIQSSFVHRTESWRNEFKKPVINDECRYEGDIQEEWGNISAFELVHRFWATLIKGGFCTHGETYYREDEVIWWAKGGELRGESVKRIAFLKDIIYRIGGELQPIPGKFTFNPNEAESQISPEELQSPIVQAIMKLDPVEMELLRMNLDRCEARHEDFVFIHYFGKYCKGSFTLSLPEAFEYTVDLVDIWEMTRETIIQRANGKMRVKLPGKEGIAVIATRIE